MMGGVLVVLTVGLSGGINLNDLEKLVKNELTELTWSERFKTIMPFSLSGLTFHKIFVMVLKYGFYYDLQNIVWDLNLNS